MKSCTWIHTQSKTHPEQQRMARKSWLHSNLHNLHKPHFPPCFAKAVSKSLSALTLHRAKKWLLFSLAAWNRSSHRAQSCQLISTGKGALHSCVCNLLRSTCKPCLLFSNGIWRSLGLPSLQCSTHLFKEGETYPMVNVILPKELLHNVFSKVYNVLQMV